MIHHQRVVLEKETTTMLASHLGRLLGISWRDVCATKFSGLRLRELLFHIAALTETRTVEAYAVGQ
jgi:hypothetical protein